MNSTIIKCKRQINSNHDKNTLQVPCNPKLNKRCYLSAVQIQTFSVEKLHFGTTFQLKLAYLPHECPYFYAELSPGSY